MSPELTNALLDWYEASGRDLPWRRRCDPYAIWVAEVMLQQTRVETVVPYYDRWMERFPTLGDLAAAPLDDVLAAWEGLGYYRRAHNLRKAAQQVVKDHAGRLPASAAELRRLPGVGAYTAAAVAAFAFGEDAIALDGNLRRVLARLIDLELDVRSPEGERRLREAAWSLLPSGHASEFNQALMDLGATVCLPRTPHCAVCPLADACLANRRGSQELRPVRARRGDLPHVTRVSGVLKRRGKVLIGRRPEGKLLGGLWEFPGGALKDGEHLEEGLARELREGLDVQVAPGAPVGTFRHSYTHYRVTAEVFECRLARGEPRPLEHAELRWVPAAELGSYPMGKIDRSIARCIQRKPASDGAATGSLRPAEIGGGG